MLPFGHVLGLVAAFVGVVEHQASGASVAPWFLAVDAHVEELAIVRVRVQWVGHDARVRFRTFRAIEFNDICQTTQ